MEQEQSKVSRKSRQGKIQIGVWIDEQVYKDFQTLAIEQRTTVGLIVENAMRSYLHQRNQK